MLNPPGIGVISSIEYSKTNLEKNFRNGVGNNTWCDAAIPRENLGYDIDRSLRDAVLGFKADSNVGLIVTVGGMAPAIAAKKYAEKRFVSLIGGTITPGFPGTITGYFCGGVNLNNFDPSNQFDYLVQHRPSGRFRPSEICLLANPDSLIADTLRRLWPFPPRGKIFWANDESGIVDAIRDFKSDNSLKAMIVSVDPFFQSHKERLIKKANEAPKKHMCYPFQIYANTGHTAPDSGHHTKHGHKLASAYYDLGRKAAFVITHDGSPSDLSSPSNPPETHEG